MGSTEARSFENHVSIQVYMKLWKITVCSELEILIFKEEGKDSRMNGIHIFCGWTHIGYLKNVTIQTSQLQRCWA
jgi:hypothetical protein